MPGSRTEMKLVGAENLINELRATGANVRYSLAGAMKAGGNVIADDAEQRAPASHKGGRKVKAKVTVRKKDHITVTIGVTKGHKELQLFEKGAHPHRIRAQNGGRLAFEGLNGLVVTPSVHHPGMPAKPFLRPAADTKADAATAAVGERLRQSIEEHKKIAEAQGGGE